MAKAGKIRYLVGREGDRKFKRNVPARLLSIAGKTAWVERIKGSDVRSLRQQGNFFAIHTDAEIARLERLLEPERSPPVNPGSIKLSYEEADQVALRYFASEDRRRIEGRFYVCSPDSPEYDDEVSDAGQEARDALKAVQGEASQVPYQIGKILSEHSSLGSLEGRSDLQELLGKRLFGYLCRRIEAANLALAEKRYSSLVSGQIAQVTDPFFKVVGRSSNHTAKIETLQPAKRVSDLVAFFLKSKSEEVGSSRFAQLQLPMRVLAEEFGTDAALADIGRDRCRELLSILPSVPAYLEQHFRGLTVRQSIDAYVKKHGSVPARHSEAQKIVQVLSSAFRAAMDEGWIDTNPWAGLSVKVPLEHRRRHADDGDGYEPFSVDQLNSLFALPLFTGCIDDEHGSHKPGPNLVRRHRYWAPIISLFSGMRMNEILQLEKEDIRFDPEGIAYFDVNDTEHGNYAGTNFRKSLKTKQAVRLIPVHPKLADLGFLDWVDGKSTGRLFPEADNPPGKKPSDVYSKRFANNLKCAGIWKPRRLVFHSFRNNFNDAMREAGTPVEIREAINGWANKHSMDARYGHGYGLRRLSQEISKVTYEGLVLSSAMSIEPRT